MTTIDTATQHVIDSVPGVERDPEYVSSARPTSSQAGQQANLRGAAILTAQQMTEGAR
ncbi:hypothetical protein [Isoptericola sp. QY 916]|uniref:hypothetical protein n=1 Tax=Isoptericola sp. QY 916 TaxID=2782570 RepID=UPI003D2FD3FD|nr:hypothetical protein [Isoptericola sp. QY 916]